MASIKINDLDPVEELTDELLESIHGGISLNMTFGKAAFDAWDPSARSSTLTGMVSRAIFDAWVP